MKTAKEKLITVTGLEKQFGGVPVLCGIDVEIDRGDVICVIGPSGSGKSTFLRCLNLLEKPNGGSIVFEGDELTDKKTDVNRHRQKMGIILHCLGRISLQTKENTSAPLGLLILRLKVGE